jgi:hypothetical protein
MFTESVESGRLVITDGSAVLEIPIAAGDWGNPDVTLNGERVPSGGFWMMIAEHAAIGEKTPRETLMREAKRAALYRQNVTPMLVYTVEPKKGDILLQDDVYTRTEHQRQRPLLARFGIIMAKLEVFNPDTVQIMHEVAKTMGLYPVAAGDKRIMYTRYPEAVFSAFQSRDFTRIYVLLKRPGSFSVHLNLKGL